MARNRFSARRTPNGTYGSVWVDGERLAECYGCQGKGHQREINMVQHLIFPIRGADLMKAQHGRADLLRIRRMKKKGAP